MITATTLFLTLLGQYQLSPIESTVLTCIAIAESKLDIKAINYSNSNGTVDYGLFQINSVHIDDNEVTIEKLLNVRSNIKIAVDVYNKEGFEAWSSYKKCR